MSITWSIFPKFLKHLSVPELASVIRQVGLDTTNLVIRDGYWVGRETFYNDLPRFMREAEREGLDVRFATAGFTCDEVIREPSLVAELAANGIREFRLSYFPIGDRDPRVALKEARAQLQCVADICQKYRIRAVYQVHFSFLVSSASAAYLLVEGLPAEHIGVELDPGNQSFEGHENFRYAAGLLGDYFVAAGIKDSALRPGKVDPAGRITYERIFAPAHQGLVDWFSFFRACRAREFAGTFVFMPFYHENDPRRQIDDLAREVAYLRDVWRLC